MKVGDYAYVNAQMINLNIKRQSNVINTRSKAIVKILVITITYNTSEDNKNLKNAHTNKLITIINALTNII